LAIVLKQVGDDFFAAQLAKTTRTARESSIELLRYEIVEQTPSPYGMDLKHYPKTTRLLKRSSQSLQPTALWRCASMSMLISICITFLPPRPLAHTLGSGSSWLSPSPAILMPGRRKIGP